MYVFTSGVVLYGVRVCVCARVCVIMCVIRLGVVYWLLFGYTACIIMPMCLMFYLCYVKVLCVVCASM